MTLPPNYDAWRLQGPPEFDDPEYCENCENNCPPSGYWHCPECDAEWPDGQGEPDGDYEYERRRDAMEDRG